MKNEESKQLNKIIIAGTFLVGLVILFTLFRSFQVNKKTPAENTATKADSQEVVAEEKTLSVEEAQTKIRNRESLTILDLRDNASFAKEHLLDAKNIPLSDLDSALGNLDPTKTYLALDAGTTVDQINIAAKIFQNHNFKNVFFLTGGFVAWKNKLATTISLGDPNSFADQAKVSYIKSDDLKTLLEKENNIFLLDVRKDTSFAEGHLKNAVNIFLDDLEGKRQQIPTGKRIVVYDKDGFWAFQAAVRLNDMGFFNVFCLSDGFDAWTQKKYEVVK